MIQRLNLNLPLSSVSFGQVSFNILRELYRRKVQCVLHPRGQPDLSAYKVDPAFGQWIERAANSRFTKLDRKVPTLNLWHIQDSQFRLSDRQVLLTFHETDSPTESEVNLVNQQDATLFTSNWSVDSFRTYGAQNVGFVPLGLDEDFAPIGRRLVSPDITHFGLIGKHEVRKNTDAIVRAWIKRYGGNRAHQLTLCIENPFYRKQQLPNGQIVGFDMNDVYANLFGAADWQKAKPFNVNVLPRLKTNAEMNQLYNALDVDLSGFSGSEGWGIPAFTATALGKWSIVTNCSAHKDWANAENAILVEPTGMKPVYDGVFFQQGGPFSQGNVYAFTDAQLDEALTRAEKLAKTPNPAGEKLRASHTYARTVDGILAEIERVSV